MTEHEKETAFLKQIIVFDDTEEGRKLEARIAQVQCDERCVKRAAGLMILLAALGGAGLAYGAVLQDNFSAGTSHFVIRLLCEIGLASLISLFALSGLLMVYRRKLNRFREECRCLVGKLLEFPARQPSSRPGLFQNQNRRPCGHSEFG